MAVYNITYFQDPNNLPLSPTPNLVIQVLSVITLLDDLTLPANATLQFLNDAMLITNENVTVTLTGDNTFIDAPPKAIFGNGIILDGSFTNAEWPVEWWAAKSDGTDAAPAINRALEQIANTGKQGTLLLTDRYEVCDTIYMQPGVAISGVTNTFSYNSFPNKPGPRVPRPTCGTLVINFNSVTSGKWVIDTPDETGAPIPDYELYVGNTNYKARFGSHYSGCNISDLRIIDKTQEPAVAQYVFGGIRLHSMQVGKIENVSIEAHVFIGLALVAKVRFFSLHNVYMRVLGCPLYMGKSCTTINAVNVTCHVWNYKVEAHPFCLKKTSPDPMNERIAPVLQEYTFPPYWDDTCMKTCGIIMEEKAHCTFNMCIVEAVDAVICGTDYNAKFISPYIENIHYTFGWLYASTNYSIPSHRYELIVEDMVSGFETFPAMDVENGEYKYLKKVNYYDIFTPPVVDIQPNGNESAMPMADDENLAVVNEKWIYQFLPTFGTVRGVVRAFNVGRATCWENDSILDAQGNLITWNYPSYFIHVSPGIQQRSFYYDHYWLVREVETDGGGAVVNESTWLEDVRYCKYKKIIVEQNDGPVRYFYHHVHDIGGSETNDNKVIWDIYKRQLQLGVSHNIATLSGEMFVRNLDNFIMTPLSASSKIDFGGIVKRKKFTIEIINAANAIQFAQPLHLHNCEITFKNSRDGLAAFADTDTNTNPDGLPYLLGLSGDCVVNFVGGFNSWSGALGKLIKLMGTRRISLRINVTDNTTGLSFSNPGNYIVNYSTFVPGCDVELDEI